MTYIVRGILLRSVEPDPGDATTRTGESALAREGRRRGWTMDGLELHERAEQILAAQGKTDYTADEYVRAVAAAEAELAGSDDADEDADDDEPESVASVTTRAHERAVAILAADGKRLDDCTVTEYLEAAVAAQADLAKAGR